MELPKLNYDDFYKFIMSAGILLFILSTFASFYLLINPSILLNLPHPWAVWIMLITILFGSSVFIIWSGKKWNTNQKLIDKRLEIDLKIKEQKLGELVSIKNPKTDSMEENRKKDNKKVALVEYKIASALPGTVIYDLIDSGKVWFWIANNSDKKYKAYVEIEFISDKYSRKEDEGYYGGKKEWNLNAFSGIRAPGILIPHEMIELAKKGKNIEIKINCTIKDEYNKLVEKKLPVSYIYNKDNKDWYFEP